jgi:hypothetical protein
LRRFAGPRFAPIATLALAFSTTAQADTSEDACRRANDALAECRGRADRETCGKESIVAYSQAAYREVNPALRADRGKECLRLAATIGKALERLPRARGVEVWRGTTMFADPAAFAPGQCLVDRGFLSSSLSREIAMEWATKEPSGLLWHWVARTGRDISAFAQQPREREILFPPRTALQVRSRRPLDGASDVTLLELDEVRAENCEERGASDSFNRPEFRPKFRKVIHP